MYEERDDLEYGRRMLAPLAGEPAGASTVDIRRAIADGRRRQRVRRVAGGSAVAAATALVVAGVPVALAAADGPDTPPPAATPSAMPASPTASSGSPTASSGPVPPSECQLQDLPVPEGAYQSLVTGGDPTGRFLLGRSYDWEAPTIQVLLWDDGEPVAVDMPGADPALDDANSSGVAVGTSYETYQGADHPVSWIYRDGQLTRLPGEDVAVSAINEPGVVVGTREDPEREQVPVVWRSATAEPEDLSVPDDSWSVEAHDVDGDGTVVGSGSDRDQRPDPPEHSFVWLPDGTRQELPMPEVDHGTVTGFAARSIQDGVVIGHATRDLGDGLIDLPAFRYDLRTGEFTGLSGGVEFGVEAWNAAGWVVGHTRDGLVLLAGSEPVALPYPELPEDPLVRAGQLPIVATVSDDGRTVAGQVHIGGGEDWYARAVAWRCR